METEAVTPPIWPPGDPEIEASLGRFVIAWAVLEAEMNLAIEQLFRLDDDLAAAVTANQGTKAKLDTFHAAAHILAELFPTSFIPDVDTLVRETVSASGDIRNYLLHGQPQYVDYPDDSVPVWVKLSARKGGIKGALGRFASADIEARTKTVRLLIDRWYALRREMAPHLANWTAMEKL